MTGFSAAAIDYRVRQLSLWLAVAAATSGCCCGGGGPYVPPAGAGSITISARVTTQYPSLVVNGDCGDSIDEAGRHQYSVSLDVLPSRASYHLRLVHPDAGPNSVSMGDYLTGGVGFREYSPDPDAPAGTFTVNGYGLVQFAGWKFLTPDGSVITVHGSQVCPAPLSSKAPRVAEDLLANGDLAGPIAKVGLVSCGPLRNPEQRFAWKMTAWLPADRPHYRLVVIIPSYDEPGGSFATGTVPAGLVVLLSDNDPGNNLVRIWQGKAQATLAVDQTAIRLDHFDYSFGSRHLTLSGTLRCAPVFSFVTPTVFQSG